MTFHCSLDLKFIGDATNLLSLLYRSKLNIATNFVLLDLPTFRLVRECSFADLPSLPAPLELPVGIFMNPAQALLRPLLLLPF